MNRTIIAAVLSLSSVVAPIAAHADSFHGGRGESHVEFRHDGEHTRFATAPVYTAPVIARPVYAQPVYAPQTVAVRRFDHGRDGWRMERGHEIRSGRVRFEHGRR